MTLDQSRRKLILQMGVSLDGVVAIPRGEGTVPVMEGEWGLGPEEPALTELKLAWVWEAGAHLMGRVTYEQMASYWPTSTHPYAAPMNEIPKVVFSKTLDRGDWPDTTIVRGDIAEGIGRLKQEPGNDLLAHGGAAFVQALARNDLVDEYRLITHPVAVGGGLPLFRDLPAPLRLELAEARTFGSTLLRVYRRPEV
jgi:dihydrofolate reductase